MASEFQIAANRRNAQRSSGPQTPEGKERSSRNAVTHGLTARAGLLAGEDPDAFIRLRREIINDLRPEDTLELELAEQIVSLVWRLRRFPPFEAALLAWLKAEVQHADHSIIKSYWINGQPGTRGDGRTEEQVQQLVLGKTIEFFLQSDFSGKLSRYETSLQRRLSALLKDLREMQAHRQKAAEAEEALRSASPPSL